jgi:hypothetical protein
MTNFKMFALLGSENALHETCLCEICVHNPDIRVGAVNRGGIKADLKSGFIDCSENKTLFCSNCNYTPSDYSDGAMDAILNSILPVKITEIKFDEDINS